MSNELDPLPHGIFQYLLGAVVTLMGGIMEYYRRRIEKISDAYVSRNDLMAHMQQMREDRQEMHRQNSDRLDKISDRIDALFDRL